MQIRWNNGFLSVGPMLCRDEYGIELAWGRRDMLGEDVREGDMWFADRKRWTIATGRGVRVHGSVWKAAIAKIIGFY